MTEERRLQFSMSTINALFDWANVLLILSLGGGVVATGTVVWTGKLKEEATNKEIAAARERTAELELEAAKLNARLAPRHLNPEQRADIAGILRAHGKPFGRMFMFPATPEAQTLTRQLFDAMRAGGWDVHSDGGGAPAILEAQHTAGVGLYYRDGGAAAEGIKALAAYLNEAGVSAEAIPWAFSLPHEFYIVVSPK